jgi:hypothetical protein
MRVTRVRVTKNDALMAFPFNDAFHRKVQLGVARGDLPMGGGSEEGRGGGGGAGGGALADRHSFVRF